MISPFRYSKQLSECSGLHTQTAAHRKHLSCPDSASSHSPTAAAHL